MRDESLMEIAELRQQILNYLLAHPEAADTVEGISKWWIGSKSEPVPREILEKVLGELLADRKIAKYENPHGSAIYTLCHV